MPDVNTDNIDDENGKKRFTVEFTPVDVLMESMIPSVGEQFSIDDSRICKRVDVTEIRQGKYSVVAHYGEFKIGEQKDGKE